MCGCRKLFVILFIYNLIGYSLSENHRISNERRCANADCSQPVSMAQTLIKYNADDKRLLSFHKNKNVKVISKEAGDTPLFWEIEVNGKRGYAPKNFLKETRVLVNPKKVNIIVPTGRDGLTENINDQFDKRKAVKLNEIVKEKAIELNEIVEEKAVEFNEILKTPELVNSKGFFATIIGASADSVPTSGQGINPQTSRKFVVVEGTTLYDEQESESDTSTSYNEETSIKPKPTDEEKKTTEDGMDQADLGEILPANLAQGDVFSNANQIQENLPDNSETKSLADEIPKDKPEIDITKTTSNLVGGFIDTMSNLISSGARALDNEEENGEEEDDYDEEDNEDVEDDGYKVSEDVIEDQGSAVPDVGTLVTSLEQEAVSQAEKNVISLNNESEHGNLPNSQSPTEIISETQVISHHDLVNISSDQNKLANEVNSSENENSASSDLNSESKPLGVSDKEDREYINYTIKEKDASNVTSEMLKTSGFEDSNQQSNDSKDDSIYSDVDLIVGTSNDSLEVGNSNEANINDEQGSVKQTINNSSGKTNMSNILDEPVESSHSPVKDPEYAQNEGKPLLHHINESTEQNDVKSDEEITTGAPQFSEQTDDKDEAITTGAPVISESLDSESVSEKTEPKEVSPDPQIDNTSSLPGDKQPNTDFMFGYLQDKTNNAGRSYNAELKINVDLEKPKNEQDTHGVQSVESTRSSVEGTGVQSDPSGSLIDDTTKDKPIFSSGLSQEIKEPPSVEVLEDSTVVSEVSESLVKETDEKYSTTENSIEQKSDIGTAQDKFIEEVMKPPPEVNYPPISDGSLQGEDDIETSTLVESNSVPEESDQGMFSSVLQYFYSFSSSNEESGIIDVTEEDETNIPYFSSSTLDKDESCQASGLEGSCDELKEVSWQDTLASADVSTSLGFIDLIPIETTIWLIITALAVLIFSLGHYYIEAHRRDGPLVAVINKLEKEVLILKKEACTLEDGLSKATQQLESWTTSSSENDALIVELKQELEETKAAKLELEEQVGVLEREVEAVTENGLEMHRLLEESLSTQDGSQVLLSTVETLRERLERQEEEIAVMSQRLSNKTLEVEQLEKRLADSAAVASDLENKIISITREKEEEALSLRDQHRQLMAQLEEVVETKALEEMRMSTELSKLRLSIEELQKKLSEKDSELDELKEVVKELRSTDSNDKMEALFDAVGVKAQLRLAVTERDETRERLNEEEGARKLLEGHMKKVTQEVTELKNNFETAEKEKIEALTKLQVLSNYFKEKELELQKELGMQESIWLQKQSDNHSIYEQMRSLREENEKFKVVSGETPTPALANQQQPKLSVMKTKVKKKSNPQTNILRQFNGLQNESLKKEIVEQEASFKIQVANVEQKAHENWVTSRQAERKLKEVQQEAAQLRNRLTSEKAAANYSLEDSKQNISESNGDPSSPPPSLMFPPTASPPFMMYPPGDFVPPPPLVSSPYHADSRPPPLGRISSPPLDHSRTTNSPPHLNMWTPPPPMPYPPYDYPPYGHHSPSPPPPMPPVAHHRNVHKPQPREMTREQKDHSPNYSPDTDKAVRRNKR